MLIGLLVFNVLLAGGAYYKKSLSRSGGLAALLLGMGIAIFTGLAGYLIMGVFFMTSTLLTKLSSQKGKHLHLEELHEKMDVRDWTQVFANGIIPLIFAALFKLTGDNAYWIGFVTAFAASNADTWASELGVLSKKPPKTLLGKIVIRPGLSGGVTTLGLWASLGGAGLIAGFAAFMTLAAYLLNAAHDMESAVSFFIGLMGQFALISIWGFMGSLLDSLMGETLQAKYKTKDPSGLITERVSINLKNVMVETELVSGLSWLNNNRVNLLSTFIVSVCSTLLAILLF